MVRHMPHSGLDCGSLATKNSINASLLPLPIFATIFLADFAVVAETMLCFSPLLHNSLLICSRTVRVHSDSDVYALKNARKTCKPGGSLLFCARICCTRLCTTRITVAPCFKAIGCLLSSSGQLRLHNPSSCMSTICCGGIGFSMQCSALFVRFAAARTRSARFFAFILQLFLQYKRALKKKTLKKKIYFFNRVLQAWRRSTHLWQSPCLANFHRRAVQQTRRCAHASACKE